MKLGPKRNAAGVAAAGATPVGAGEAVAGAGEAEVVAETAEIAATGETAETAGKVAFRTGREGAGLLAGFSLATQEHNFVQESVF